MLWIGVTKWLADRNDPFIAKVKADTIKAGHQGEIRERYNYKAKRDEWCLFRQADPDEISRWQMLKEGPALLHNRPGVVVEEW